MKNEKFSLEDLAAMELGIFVPMKTCPLQAGKNLSADKPNLCFEHCAWAIDAFFGCHCGALKIIGRGH